MSDLVVDHPTAELLSGSPDHLGVVAGILSRSEKLSQLHYYYTKKVVLHPGVDCLTVEAWISDLVVPVLGRVRHQSLHGGLVLLLGVPAPVGVLTHRGPVQFLPHRVVTKGALVRPSLSDGLQLHVPDLEQGMRPLCYYRGWFLPVSSCWRLQAGDG